MCKSIVLLKLSILYHLKSHYKEMQADSLCHVQYKVKILTLISHSEKLWLLYIALISRPPLITTHAVNNFNLSLLLFSLLPFWFILHCTSRLILLKHIFIHVILWLKSLSYLLALQNFIQAPSPHIPGLSFDHLPLSTSPLTLFPVTKIFSDPLKFISFSLWSTWFFFFLFNGVLGCEISFPPL